MHLVHLMPQDAIHLVTQDHAAVLVHRDLAHIHQTQTVAQAAHIVDAALLAIAALRATAVLARIQLVHAAARAQAVLLLDLAVARPLQAHVAAHALVAVSAVSKK
jgi:hypothetical protein